MEYIVRPCLRFPDGNGDTPAGCVSGRACRSASDRLGERSPASAAQSNFLRPGPLFGEKAEEPSSHSKERKKYKVLFFVKSIDFICLQRT